jgi:acyl-CoA synthetase (AMP-forming)/AMP-acid ligase II/lysophospholipase L1-like esterase
MKIVCFGDSLTSCGGEDGRYSDLLQDRFPDHQFVNRGVGGNTFVDALARLDADVIAERPDIVLLALGANDWWRAERPPEEWAADLVTCIVRCQAIGAKVVVMGVFGDYWDAQGHRQAKTYGIDERAIAYRQMEAAIARRYGCPYVANIQERIIGDRLCWRDRNHPNERGNRRVADAVEPALIQLLQAAPRPVRMKLPQTTRDFWDEAVARRPDKLAVIAGDQRLTYAEADAQAERLAAGLARAAGTARPKVACYLPNCLEFYLVYWAVVKLGGVIVPLNTWLSEENLGHIFARVQPDVLIHQGERDGLLLGKLPLPRAVFALQGQGERAFSRLAADGPAPRPAIAPDDPAIVMHTSGTTAAPKGAIMRHSDLMFNVTAAINAHQFVPSDVHLLVNPMFHCTALYSSLPSAACQASTIVITAETDAAALLRTIARHRVTTCLTIPTICQRLTAVPSLADYDLSALRLIAYAGSMMPVSTIHALQKLFPGVDLHNFFGLTETISMTHVLTGEQAEERPDSIGRLLPFVEAIVVDEALAPLPAGQVGELLFARDNVIPGYYGQPELLDTALVEVQGRTWFRTGDLACIDADGFFFIKGRKKDMIIVGGENVFSAEVEAVLMAHDGVQEAAIVGVPATGIRAALGELIYAYVVRRDPALTERDLRKYCHQRLASFKIPHYLEFIENLPRNPSGKVVKADLPPPRV